MSAYFFQLLFCDIKNFSRFRSVNFILGYVQVFEGMQVTLLTSWLTTLA